MRLPAILLLRTLTLSLPAVACGFGIAGQESRGTVPHNYQQAEGDDSKPAEQVFPGIYASVMLETVYYVECGERAVLIDTGWDHTFEKHLARFEKAGLDPERIDAVLATHSHVDHLAGARRARTTKGIPVVAHRNAVAVKSAGDRAATAARIPALGWDANDLPATIDFPVDDGDTVEIGGRAFRVYHLPGHTPDSVGYQLGDLLFTGDMFGPRANHKMFWPGWSDIHWGSNTADLLESFEKIGSIAPRFCLPSHGRPFPFDGEFLANGIRRLKEGAELFYGPVNLTVRAARRTDGTKPATHAIPRRKSRSLAEPVSRLNPAFVFSFNNGLGLVRPGGERAGIELIPFESKSLLGDSGFLLRLGDVLAGTSPQSTRLITPLTGAVASADGASLAVRFRPSIAPSPLASVAYAAVGDTLEVRLEYLPRLSETDPAVFVLESLLPGDAIVESSQDGKWKRVDPSARVGPDRTKSLRIGRPGSRLLALVSADSGFQVAINRSGLLSLQVQGARAADDPAVRAVLRLQPQWR